jgi:1-acyl-sn-glycerol-3-phosphate acyltransferase
MRSSTTLDSNLMVIRMETIQNVPPVVNRVDLRSSRSWLSRVLRRMVTVPLVWMAAAFFLATLPLSLAVVLLGDVVRRKHLVCLRLWAFVGGYLMINIGGQLALLGAWLGSAGGLIPKRLVRWTYAIQQMWAGLLFRCATRIWSLHWQVSGQEHVPATPAIFLVRHTSLIDTLIPTKMITEEFGIPLHFVLKKELLFEPCLDIAGHWLPNHFVDREPDDSRGEIAAIELLAKGLGSKAGLLIYPEGTRFSESKRQRVIQRLVTKHPELAQRARLLQHTLLPRVSGTLALMRGAPLADIVMVGHEGLSGFSTLADMWSGELIGREILVQFWRYPASELPSDEHDRAVWLYERWAQLDRWVGEHQCSQIDR